MPTPPPPPEHRWPPGQSGNPAGYSRGRRITDALHRRLEVDATVERIVDAIIGKATGDETLLDGLNPDARFLTILLDRTEGKLSPLPAEVEQEITVRDVLLDAEEALEELRRERAEKARSLQAGDEAEALGEEP